GRKRDASRCDRDFYESHQSSDAAQGLVGICVTRTGKNCSQLGFRRPDPTQRKQLIMKLADPSDQLCIHRPGAER
ncbi:hypothetical protein AMECASPLE_019293, partial [Ameca splendens]